MIQNADAQLRKLRADPRIEKANLIRHPNGSEEAWITLRVEFDPKKMHRIVEEHGCELTRFGTIPSMMPRMISEMLWSGTSYVIAKKLGLAERLKGLFGIEPGGLAKISKELHLPHYDFIADSQEGLDILYDYLSQ